MTGQRVPVARLLDALESAGLVVSVTGPLPEHIASITSDSRAVISNSCFVAVRGTVADGHAYLPAAEEAGATCAIVQDERATALPAIVVRNGRRAAAVAAAAFYERPAESVRLVGVTGTNGKTTTVGLLRALLESVGMRTASVGTLGVLTGRDGVAMPGGQGLTTPGPIEMQRLLRELVDHGIDVVVMEVSSHALAQHRVEGLAFDVAVFTNFTRDHLDYHGTMDAYFAAKAQLVHALTPDGVAVVNAGDVSWGALPAAPRTLSFLVRTDADATDPATSSDSRLERADLTLLADHVAFDATGSRFDVCLPTKSGSAERLAATLPLLGDFNVTNALGAVSAAWALGAPLPALVRALGAVPQVPGRLERLSTSPSVLRDYAHTPDALDRALRAVRPFACTPDGAPTRVLVVFGCGGDRDRGKRPEMGRIAEALADVVVVTSDNPRTEDPEQILDDIVAGMTRAPALRIEDRRSAIAAAIDMAGAHDVVLLAGKGHETYQIRGTEQLPFDEAAIVADLLRTQVRA